jgi:pyruvate/2-oxoglutarate dehydrogenase complex dihydrolipoamide dehydrogenase (E3) component
VALSNLLLRFPRSIDYDLIPRCTYTDPEVASVGLDETRARERNIPYRVFTAPFGEVDRAEAEGRTAGRIKVLVGKRGKIIGCSIVGPGAGELIHEWAVALKGRLKLSVLASTVHAYPTLSEISKKGAGLYYAEKLFTPRVRCLLRLLFGVGKDRAG